MHSKFLIFYFIFSDLEEEVEEDERTISCSLRISKKGFFRQFCVGLLIFSLLISFLAGSCFMVHLFSYEEAFIVSSCENRAIKAWVLTNGNVIDVNQTEGCLRRYHSPATNYDGK